jgi:hypothetical protein
MINCGLCTRGNKLNLAGAAVIVVGRLCVHSQYIKYGGMFLSKEERGMFNCMYLF